ncbi:hypothetical protein TWF718_005268 [Orbilia javanica]|uniref:Uncharacterized protein n=1 Tax=Orbilia javanica TaxID=47235 RepID=A0AAN8RNS7_9PEZI
MKDTDTKVALLPINTILATARASINLASITQATESKPTTKHLTAKRLAMPTANLSMASMQAISNPEPTQLLGSFLCGLYEFNGRGT